MRNIWLVIKHEIGTVLRKRSFWVLTFLMPAALLIINVYTLIQQTEQDDREETSTPGERDASSEAAPSVGLVDAAGFIRDIPPAIPNGLFRRFPDEAAARVALDADEIGQYVIIPDDYLTSGRVTVYAKDFQILESGEDTGVTFSGSNAWILSYLINFNLTGDELLATTLRNPTPVALAEFHALRPADASEAEGDRPLAMAVAMAMPYIYYFILIISSGYMLQSVTAEKENRTVEVLLLSLRPRELMIGKILGLTAVVLVQVVVWLGGGMLIVGQGATLFDTSRFSFPPGFFLWAVLFLVLGYLLYASVMAAAGAMANTAREGAQMTWILILPLLPTLTFASEFLNEPHGTLSLVLSLFPFSAPSAMVTRIALATVPWWQIGISITGLALTAFFMVSMAGRFFRPHNLLSGASFDWRRFARGWRD
jgi:ABC-2 type transport system permease protein